MGGAKSWLWNVNKTEEEARKILKDPGHPAFLLYAARRLATANLPKEIFRDYLSRENFLIHWPAIKRQMKKDSRNHDRVLFWDGVYDYLRRDLKAKGISLGRPNIGARVDPVQQRDGQHLRELRRSKKMTQVELAREAGVTQQHIAKIEKGLTVPRPQTLEKIERALGASRYEYKTEDRPFSGSVITEPVTTWFVDEPGRQTASK